MAIYITKKHKTKESRNKEANRFHEALAGSPAYVNGEIAITMEGDLEVTLCIGNNNDNNFTQTYKRD